MLFFYQSQAMNVENTLCWKWRRNLITKVCKKNWHTLTSYESRDSPDIFSHVDWDFVYQRKDMKTKIKKNIFFYLVLRWSG